MKSKKQKANVEVNSAEKFCKKCGDPLRSTAKYKYCVNCRRERAEVTREVLGMVGGVCLMGLSLVPGIKHFTKKK